MTMLKPDERIDDLQLNGLSIIQSASGFRFGMDAVLLSDFAQLRPNERVADMGTGTGIIPILMSQKRGDTVFEAFEIQPAMADMARRSVEMNGLAQRIHIHAMDMRLAPQLLGANALHAVTLNPPYGKRGSAIPSQTDAVLTAKHEADITIDEILKTCALTLRGLGRLYMVFPAQRLLELCDDLRRCRLEPKQIRMVCTKLDKPPYLALVEAVKSAKPSLRWLPPLIVCDAEGRETPEIKRIYHRAD